jgi:hypothetical protein
MVRCDAEQVRAFVALLRLPTRANRSTSLPHHAQVIVTNSRRWRSARAAALAAVSVVVSVSMRAG